MKKIVLKGFTTEIEITANTSREDLAKFVSEEANHWIECLEDGIRKWTHEIEYCSIFDEERGCRVFDNEETVRVHTEHLVKFLREDFSIEIK